MTVMRRKKVIDELRKKRLNELIQKGEKPTIIAGFIDLFGDAAITTCSKCEVPVLVRPWLLVAMIEHGLSVVCLRCVDPRDFAGQLAMDFAKIEEEMGE